MPGCPLHNACVRPAWLTGRRDQRPPRGGLVADLALLVVHPSDLWEQSLLARRPSSRPGSPGRTPIQLCGSRLAREGGLTVDRVLAAVLRPNCGSEPAREGGLTTDLALAAVLQSKCGSELAREGGITVGGDVEFAGLFASKLNWSSKSGHQLRCLCCFLLHGYWRQVVVVAVEPGAVVVHEEAHHIGLCFLARAVTVARDPF